MNTLLNVLTREGVLLKVSVSFWRGCKKLKPEDIGLKAGDLSDRLISLGHKRLLPKDATAALTLVESRAHAFVEDHSLRRTSPCLLEHARSIRDPRIGGI